MGGVRISALVLAGGADVGELLALDDVDDEVVVARVLADDHALVDARLRVDHHGAAVLQVEERVGGGLAGGVGDQHAGAAAGDLALERRVVVEQAVHDGGAARVGQQLALVADQAAGRHVEHQALAAAARGAHLHEVAAALGQLLHDDAGVLLVDVDDDLLDRLEPLAGVGIGREHAPAGATR